MATEPSHNQPERKPQPRSGHVAVSLGRFMLVWGGFNEIVSFRMCELEHIRDTHPITEWTETTAIALGLALTKYVSDSVTWSHSPLLDAIGNCTCSSQHGFILQSAALT